MHTEQFFDIFPPPKYINVPYAALAFSESSLRVLSLDHKSKVPTFSAKVGLEAGVIVGGKVAKVKELSQALESLKKSINTKFVRFSIPDESAYVFVSKVPASKGKDLKEGISFIMEENVPLPLSDITFDFIPKRIEETQSGILAETVVVAASIEVVRSYVEAIKNTGLEPLLCANESQAVANSVVPRNTKKPSIILHIHKKNIGIYMTDGPLVEFSSTIPINDENSSSLVEVAMAELDKSINYLKEKDKNFFSNNPGERISCYLCGEYDLCSSLVDQLKSIDQIAVLLSNVWVNAFDINKYVPEISFKDSLLFSPAVGLLV